MKFTAEQIAEVLEGKIDGNPEVEVSELAKIEEGKVGSLTFLSNPKYTEYIYNTEASICIVNNDFQPEKPINPTLIRVENSYSAFTKLLEFYDQYKKSKTGIESPHFISESADYGEDIYIGAFAYIGENVKIGDNVKIYPHVYIGDNVKIGNNVTLFPGVKLYSDVVVGNNCTIHGNVVIGSDGFGYAPDEKGVFKKIPQIGNVVIEDDVEIGSATTIDRATMGSTVIEKGVKLDNQIQVAHNVVINQHTAIAAQTGIAGSTKIGKHCIVGGQVGIAGHLKIGDGTKIQAQTGVGKSLKAGAMVQGSPALKYGTYNKSYIHFKNLPDLERRLRKVEKKLDKDG